MAIDFLSLPERERREIISAASGRLGILPALVEKDVWVCWVLDVLFSIPGRRPMVFKGGTSLSKVFNLIRRFSEDVDISINFIDDYEKPISKTKASKIRADIEEKLQDYKKSVLTPALESKADDLELVVEPGSTEWEIHVNYESVLASRADYIKSRIKIELSGRNETEPSKRFTVKPYLEKETTELNFPEATIEALLAERTFWEKVTLIHAGLNSGTIEKTAERMSRHWSDLVVLMNSEIGRQAIEDKELSLQVINHKDSFWRDGKAKYADCRHNKYRLVPEGETLQVVKEDYQAMVSAGMFFDEVPPTFDEILEDISKLESMLNKKA